MRYLLFSVLLAIAAVSCGEYQKAIRSQDVALKVKFADSLYKKQDYRRALALFDQIRGDYMGKPQGERIFYMYGVSAYRPNKENGGDYDMAAEIFRIFLEQYPQSERAQEALYYEGKSNYFLSGPYSLDQENTYHAIDILQQYINEYPEGEHFEEVNKMILELTAKLEKKSFEIAKQYGTIEDYQACIRASELFLNEYPGSRYSEDSYYNMLYSSYVVATNSVQSKEKERLEEASKIYRTLMRRFPNTKYADKANKINKTVQENLAKLTTHK